MTYTKEEHRRQLIAAMKNWKLFIQDMDAEHRTLMWKAVLKRSKGFQKVLMEPN